MKFNPCACGSAKYQKEDTDYEIDKFDDVVSLMDGLVVSLDPDLMTLTRIWVVAEIGQALANKKPIQFRMTRGLAPEPLWKLQNGEPLLPPVGQCHASCEKDKQMILAKIDGTVGQDLFDEFVWCMVEISFGRCWRLLIASGNTVAALCELRTLEIDGRWSRDWLVDSAELGVEHLAKLKGLVRLHMTFSHCWCLHGIIALSIALGQLNNLLYLQVDLSHTSVNDVHDLGAAVAKLSLLQHLDLAFSTCSLKSISALCIALLELRQLVHLRLVFFGCSILDISKLGRALSNLSSLKHLLLDFAGLEAPRISAVEESLMRLPNLEDLQLRFPYSRKLQDISGLDRAFSTMCNLSRLQLFFLCCQQLALVPLFNLRSILMQLHHVDVDFSGCALLPLHLQRRFTSRDDMLKTLW